MNCGYCGVTDAEAMETPRAPLESLGPNGC